jgi:hypothetical protein
MNSDCLLHCIDDFAPCLCISLHNLFAFVQTACTHPRPRSPERLPSTKLRHVQVWRDQKDKVTQIVTHPWAEKIA